jgi:hypothetical protein
MALELNAEMHVDLSEASGYSIQFVDLQNENAILIFVRYLSSTNRDLVNLAVKGAKDVISTKAKQRGWSSWLKVRESVEAVEISSRSPWLKTKDVTELDWLILEEQAAHGETEFGENGVVVSYSLGPRSVESGIVYCEILYLPETRAELVQVIEDGIKSRFEITRKRLPWATLEVSRKVARTTTR